MLVIASAGCGSHDRGPRVFVSNENAGTVSVIDPAKRAVVATITVGKRPRGLRVSRDGGSLYVALSGSPKAAPGVDESTLPPPDRKADGIGVVDLDKLELVRVLPGGQDPESFDLVGDDLLVVSNEETSEATLIDLDDRAIRARVVIGKEPEGVTTAPDGLVWITSEGDGLASALDPKRREVVAIVPTGQRPRAIAFTRDGRLGVVTNENDGTLTLIDGKNHASLGSIALPRGAGSPPRPMGVAIDRDDHTAYVTTGRAGSVAVIDLDKRAVLRTIAAVGARPWGIAVGKDGLVYTANGPSNDVSILDPKTARVVQRIPTGGSPWGVAVTP
ncbi:MAG TPA: hypothetical protein VFQ53_05515 [Kofleriaceae bacterium]|nr:hypothetical protein [Kofleriaceae bacterium]